MVSPEKAMAPHSSTLAWKIPWMEEPGRMQSMGSLSRTWLSDFIFTFHFHALEKETATHSSVLAWRIPGTGEPGGLLSLGSHRVGHDWSDLAAGTVDGRSFVNLIELLEKGLLSLQCVLFFSLPECPGVLWSKWKIFDIKMDSEHQSAKFTKCSWTYGSAYHFKKNIYIYILIWRHRVSVVACGILLGSRRIFTVVHWLSSCDVLAQSTRLSSWGCGLSWRLGSLTRDQTCVPCIARQILNHR